MCEKLSPMSVRWFILLAAVAAPVSAVPPPPVVDPFLCGCPSTCSPAGVCVAAHNCSDGYRDPGTTADCTFTSCTAGVGFATGTGNLKITGGEQGTVTCTTYKGNIINGVCVPGSPGTFVSSEQRTGYTSYTAVSC